MRRPSLALMLVLVIPSVSPAWHECGHHATALIAYDLLSDDHQKAFVELLREHPRFEEDFEAPEDVNNETRYWVGRAAYWPDVARELPEYNRPRWHYDATAPALVVGDRSKIELPPRRDPLARLFGATLDTDDLNIDEAMLTCGLVLSDPRRDGSDRAIALCWVLHLMGDCHQPCHAGSLYAERLFDTTDGDRGGNDVALVNGGNLHALWDGLLGGWYDENKINRVVADIKADSELIETVSAEASADRFSVRDWLAEGRKFSNDFVYTNEVLGQVRAVVEGKADRLPELTVSEDYLKNAGAVAKYRACQAGYRMAKVLSVALERGSPPVE